MPSFECSVPGKWILAGEHSVLRGSPALVFPLTSRQLKLQFFSRNTAVVQDSNRLGLQLELAGEHGAEYELLFWGVLDHAVQVLKFDRGLLAGEVKLISNLPVGAGLGASAALCIAVAKWFSALGAVEEAHVFRFAKSFEDLFHGESSGVDIAVSLSGQPLRFLREGGQRMPLNLSWKPKWYLSYSGKRGLTLDCVKHVKSLKEKDPELFHLLDGRMKDSVVLAEQALAQFNLDLLARAINQAGSCFEEWGLIDHQLRKHIELLQQAGAIACKPTGSGGGGYVLSLWTTDPKIGGSVEFVPC